MNEKMLAFQQGNYFPMDTLPEWFRDAINRALTYFSPVGAKMAVSDFVTLVNKNVFTLYDLGFILHIMEVRTAKDMNMDIVAYCEYIQAIDAVVKQWRGIVQPYQEQLQAEYDKYQAEQIAGQVAVQENEKGKTIALGQA